MPAENTEQPELSEEAKIRKLLNIEGRFTKIFISPFAFTILYVENRKLSQRAPSPSDFRLLNYFWIHFTCGFDIRDYGCERVNKELLLK